MTVVPINAVSGEWSVGHIAGLGRSESPAGAGAAIGAPEAQPTQATSGGVPGVQPTGPGNFGEALTSAVSSLDQTQQSANSAARALATGTVSDPESAVVTVEDAQLAMQLAGQIRTKATEAAQQIFQTQV
jgi:flagellar hook-basal body complex protein FliE